MVIRTKDGRTSTSTVFEPKGAASRGIAWTDVDAKYRALLPETRVPQPRIEANLAVIHDFQAVRHVSALIDLI